MSMRDCPENGNFFEEKTSRPGRSARRIFKPIQVHTQKVRVEFVNLSITVASILSRGRGDSADMVF